MASPHERSTLRGLFYGLGYVLAQLEAPAGGGAETESAGDAEAEAAGLPFFLDSALPMAVTGWLLARVLRPAPVSWPRVVLAGVAATTLSRLTERLERRARGETPVEPEGAADAIARYAAGVASTAAYAAVLYPRLPGPPAARGLLFGALEAAAAPAGGTFALLRRLSPRLSFPLADLTAPRAADARPAAHVAFGLGVGLLYRGRGARQ